MMKVLLVDDDSDAIDPLKEEMSRNDVLFKQIGFDQVKSKISSFAPDLVVLDLFLGDPTEGTDPGHDRLRWIWDQCFLPVIVYSANPAIVLEDEFRNHPFIKFIEKGSGSELRVKEAIEEFRPLVEELRQSWEQIESEFSKALRDVAPLGRERGDQLPKIIERAARRRVAALVDELDSRPTPIQAWEQYIFPPISQNIRQGDVLRRKCDDPELVAAHFCVVMTASCDLVASSRRSPKVDRVLVARCIDVGEALKAINISRSLTKKEEERLFRVLSTGTEGHIIFFPSLSDEIPSMAADLRKLELLSFGDIKKSYDVVASVDSPFREAIAWAYMRAAARPGLPERDTKSWVDEIIGEVSPKKSD